MSGAQLELANARFHAGSFDLDVPRLSVAPGEIVAFLGANGAGKSTLLRLIAGLVPHQAELALLGRSFDDYGDLERGRTLAWVPQSEEHEFDFSVADLVEMGRFPLGEGGLIGDILPLFDLVHLASAKTKNLSAGELQRTLLARAFATGAPILLLDEPTAHLDARHARDLAKILRETDKTVLMATHDLSWAAGVADRLLLMKQGRVLADVSPREIEGSALVEEVYGMKLDHARTDSGRNIWVVPVE